MQNKPITDQIVSSSSGWDEAGDFGDIQLYDAVLAVDTKLFKKGDKVRTVVFCFSKSILEIWNSNGPIETWPMKLSLDLSCPLKSSEVE